MKIAFLTPEYPHPKTGNSGGIGTSIYNLAKGLVLQKHQVSILVYAQNCDEVLKDNEITIYKIKNIKVKGLSLYLTQKKVEKLINKLYTENKIDVVEATDWTGFTSFINPKCPLLIKINGSDTYFCNLDNRPVKLMNKFHEKRALKNADGVIAVSKFAGDLTKKLFDLQLNFSVIPNAVDINQFKALNIKKSENTILYFGTIIRKKGLLELPLIFNEVYKRNNKVRLILVGKDAADIISGNLSTWNMMCDLFDNEAFQNVEYCGEVAYSDVKKHIVGATICVFPSFAEALPVSWLEAMAMEKAIVASNIGWSNEIITNGLDGFVDHPKEHKVFANRILEILDNPDLKEKLGQNARINIVNNFSTEVIVKKTIAFYSEIINKK